MRLPVRVRSPDDGTRKLGIGERIIEPTARSTSTTEAANAISAELEGLALTGEPRSAGTHGAATTVAATVGFAMLGAGPLGLLTRGTNAKLKAGEIIIGYVANDTAFSTAEKTATDTVSR